MRSLLSLLALLLLVSPVRAQKILPDAPVTTAQASNPNACATGVAEVDMEVNNVRARLYNTGGLFSKGGPNVYSVPATQEGFPSAIYAAGIWMGGKVNGEPRVAAANYGGWEFYPGPLDASGNPPTDCTPYDRIFKITKLDIAAYESNGSISDALRDWPFAWGAPVIDGDGNPNNYSLVDGDRPEVLGDEMYWWVMNDVGPHPSTGTAPIGAEVRVSAFAFDIGGTLGNTTFYRYQVTYRGTEPLTDAFLGFWFDPDLGNATDDQMGADTTLDMAFVYNDDNIDEGTYGYGTAPPALGIVVLEGPTEGGVEHGLDRFIHFDLGIGPFAEPRAPSLDWYTYLQGRALSNTTIDGTPLIACGNGHYTTGLACESNAQPTRVIFPGDPVTGQFWSARNYDGAGNTIPPNDRKGLVSMGPLTMEAGEMQSFLIGIVWARGDDNLDSITKLREAVGATVQKVGTSVERGSGGEMVRQLVLEAPAPSPARQQATVRFGLAQRAVVRVALYDVLGREVAQVFDGEQTAGWHQVSLATDNLASGVYFVRVVTGGEQQAQAVVVAR